MKFLFAVFTVIPLTCFSLDCVAEPIEGPTGKSFTSQMLPITAERIAACAAMPYPGATNIADLNSAECDLIRFMAKNIQRFPDGALVQCILGQYNPPGLYDATCTAALRLRNEHADFAAEGSNPWSLVINGDLSSSSRGLTGAQDVTASCVRTSNLGGH